jgi:type I restriction enzyme R subunit
VLGWRQKIQARAKVRVEIENVLDEGLPRAYSKELYESKCNTVFEHVFESYQGEGRSVFA